MAALDRVLPPHWSHGNPVDLIGDADAERYARAVEIVARDPGNDGVLVVLTRQAVTDPTEIARRLTAFAQLEGKPILASFMGGASVAEATEILDRAGIPTFAYPDSATQAFCYLWQYRHALDALYETPTLALGAEGTAARSEAGRIIERRAQILANALDGTGIEGVARRLRHSRRAHPRSRRTRTKRRSKRRSSTDRLC